MVASQGQYTDAHEGESDDAHQRGHGGRPQGICGQHAGTQVKEEKQGYILYQVNFPVVIPDEKEGQGDKGNQQGLGHEGYPFSQHDAACALPGEQQQFVVSGEQFVPDGGGGPQRHDEEQGDDHGNPEDDLASVGADEGLPVKRIDDEAEQEEKGEQGGHYANQEDE